MKNAIETLKDEFYDGEWDELMGSLNTDVTPSVVNAMIKFAKLHVDKALDSASNNGEIYNTILINGESKPYISKASILNSYKVDNIK